MPKLLLHAGTPKTGTTSIQTVLAEARPWLRQRGFLYPDGEGIFGDARPHHHFAHGLSGEDREKEERSIRYIEAVARRATPGETIVISSEPLYRHVCKRSAEGDFWSRKRRYLQRLSRLLAGFDTTVLLYFRNKDDFSASMEAEMRMKKIWPGRERFDGQMARHSDYDRQVATFERYFKVQRRDFDEARAGPGLIADFFGVLDIPAPPGLTETWVRTRGTKPTFGRKPGPGGPQEDAGG